MSWLCPYAKRSKYFENRLYCEKCVKDGINYAEPKSFVGIMCLYQKFCNCKSVYLNTDTAKECYKIKSETKKQ